MGVVNKEIDEKDWDEFQQYLDKRKKRLLIKEIGDRMPRGIPGKNSILAWFENLPASTLEVVLENYNPLPNQPAIVAGGIAEEAVAVGRW